MTVVNRAEKAGRRSTTTRDEEPTGWLPGLAAAAKEQHASHGVMSLAGGVSPASRKPVTRGPGAWQTQDISLY
jgi:hypothetical protein